MMMKYKLILFSLIVVGAAVIGMGGASVSAAPVTPVFAANHYCGDKNRDDLRVKTGIDIGCRGAGNPITDMLFAFIRLLSNGVGIVIVISLVVAGIQYTTSAGDPQASAKAQGRVRATLIALALYVFAYPLLNYLIPAGFFK